MRLQALVCPTLPQLHLLASPHQPARSQGIAVIGDDPNEVHQRCVNVVRREILLRELQCALHEPEGQIEQSQGYNGGHL